MVSLGGCLILALNLAYRSHKWDCFMIYNRAYRSYNPIYNS